MPAPSAPTAFSITQESDGSPLVTLAWSHTGTNLDRFEVLTRMSGDTTWKSLALAPKAEFGTGPYSYETTATTGQQFAVRAIASDGMVSV